MEIVLTGKNALVGGSSKGIGLAIAQQLSKSGANVTLMARNEAKLKEVLASLSTKNGQNHSYLLVDFSNFEAFKKTFLHFLSRIPSIF